MNGRASTGYFESVKAKELDRLKRFGFQDNKELVHQPKNLEQIKPHMQLVENYADATRNNEGGASKVDFN